LDRFGSRPECGRAFSRVEGRNPATRSRSDIKKLAAIREAARDCVNCTSDLRQLSSNRCCHAFVFAIDDAKNLERRFLIEPM
jgi:hypothetical protein